MIMLGTIINSAANLVWGKKVRVANMLPALVIAVIAAYIPAM
nr:DUF554 domain-containing protein [Butyrivibrio sp. WCE2006]